MNSSKTIATCYCNFRKKFGKKKIKIVKNIMQVFIIASVFLFYKHKLAALGLFVVNTINRFIDCGNVIDSAIESDMRDNQQYLTGERIDGAFGFIQSYAGGVIGAVTGLFIPWVYKKKGFDGNDYSVLDVYSNYDETLPLSQQTKNPNCVLYSLMDTLLVISVIGAAIDVLPWFAYDISEIGQKSMIRVIRIRTIVEDRKAKMNEDSSYIEGCEAIFKAEKYYGKEKITDNRHEELKAAKLLPHSTDEEKSDRHMAITEAKQHILEVEEHNNEIVIADFVMHELHRFENEFGKKQMELCSMITAGGPQHFFDCAEDAIIAANSLPLTEDKEERTWRKQEIRNARALLKSRKMAAKHYPDGIVEFDPRIYENAYDMPDETRSQAKERRAAMKAASKQRNTYALVASPYLTALRTLDLAEGYEDLSSITGDYDLKINEREIKYAEEKKENERLALERRLDKENKNAQKRLGKRK